MEVTIGKNNKMLDLIHTDDGVVNVSDSTYDYEYFLKDHLGNTRASFKPDDSGVLTPMQTVDYYPFGMIASKSDNASDNKYLYNGKELQDDDLDGINLDWYDYGARFYDPVIARWHSIDPLAEKYHDRSPYVYVYDDPICFIDMDGQEENPYKKFKGLSPEEKNFIKNNKKAAIKINRNANRATRKTVKHFGYNGLNDKSDAFRHTLWQALNTQGVGKEKTQEYADAHETDTPKGREKEKEMDDHNNSLGISIGLDNPDASLKDIVNAVLNALDEGKGVEIDPETGEIVPTTPDPEPEPGIEIEDENN